VDFYKGYTSRAITVILPREIPFMWLTDNQKQMSWFTYRYLQQFVLILCLLKLNTIKIIVSMHLANGQSSEVMCEIIDRYEEFSVFFLSKSSSLS